MGAVRMSDETAGPRAGTGMEVDVDTRLEVLFDPRSVAVVGACADPAKWGYWPAQGAPGEAVPESTRGVSEAGTGRAVVKSGLLRRCLLSATG
jgi:hypothetical protein